MPCSSWLTDDEPRQSRFTYLFQGCRRTEAKEKCIFLSCPTQVLGTNHSCLGSLSMSLAIHLAVNSLLLSHSLSSMAHSLCKGLVCAERFLVPRTLHCTHKNLSLLNHAAVIFFFFFNSVPITCYRYLTWWHSFQGKGFEDFNAP